MRKSKKILNILFVMLLMFIPFISVKADDVMPINSDVVEQEEAIEYDLNESYFEADENITFNKTVFGSSIIAGDNVNIDGNIDGILIGAGNSIKHSGSSSYAIIAGNTLNISGTYEREALIAGNVINIENANFGRDAFIFGNAVTLSGEITRNIIIYAENVDLSNAIIHGDAKIVANNMVISSNVIIDGQLSCTNDKNIDKSAQIGSINIIEGETTDVNYTDILVSKLISFVSLLLTGVVLFFVCPKLFNKTSETKFSFMQILTLCGDGLLLLVFAPIICVILLTTVIGAPLGLIGLFIYCIALYLSNIFAGYYTGKFIWNDIVKKEDNIFIDALVGISILFVLYLIPVIGVITSIVCFLTGLGLIVISMKKK